MTETKRFFYLTYFRKLDLISMHGLNTTLWSINVV